MRGLAWNFKRGIYFKTIAEFFVKCHPYVQSEIKFGYLGYKNITLNQTQENKWSTKFWKMCEWHLLHWYNFWRPSKFWSILFLKFKHYFCFNVLHPLFLSHISWGWSWNVFLGNWPCFQFFNPCGFKSNILKQRHFIGLNEWKIQDSGGLK